MRTLLFLSLCFSFSFTQAQTLPFALKGTWKIEGKNEWEHWDSLNPNTLQGFVYQKSKDKIEVLEYLSLQITPEGIRYTAQVLGQNQGKPVTFTGNQSDHTLTLANNGHDWPQQIKYTKESPQMLKVQVGKFEETFTQTYHKWVLNNALTDSTIANPNYDAQLAKELGADDYGMKSFVLVILKTGNNTTSNQAFIDSCFRGHLDNINRLVDEKKLIVAGPLGKNDLAYRGIFILDVKNGEEAQQLLQTDPAIHAQLLDAEIIPWYGSAALPLYLEASDKIWKTAP